MNTAFRFWITAIVFLSTGCAAPTIKVVATRQGGTIDQHLFKEGDEVWVTYNNRNRDEYSRVGTKRGIVIDIDNDSDRRVSFGLSPTLNDGLSIVNTLRF